MCSSELHAGGSTTLICSAEYTLNGAETPFDGFHYEYDKPGNITAIYRCNSALGAKGGGTTPSRRLLVRRQLLQARLRREKIRARFAGAPLAKGSCLCHNKKRKRHAGEVLT